MKNLAFAKIEESDLEYWKQFLREEKRQEELAVIKRQRFIEQLNQVLNIIGSLFIAGFASLGATIFFYLIGYPVVSSIIAGGIIAMAIGWTIQPLKSVGVVQ